MEQKSGRKQEAIAFIVAGLLGAHGTRCGARMMVDFGYPAMALLAELLSHFCFLVPLWVFLLTLLL